LFKRDWRQQVLVIGLLTFAVAAATFLSIAISSAIPSPQGEFGDANLLIRQRGGEGPRMDANLDAFRHQYGTIEVIRHTAVPIPGSVDELDVRAQDPHGAFGSPMLRLLDGRYPTAADEIAMTNGAAADFHAHVGGSVSLAGVSRTVVGIVENPAKLDDEFALGVAAGVPADTVEVLARGDFDPGGGGLVRGGATFSVQRRDRNDKPLAAALVLLLSSVLLMLVALVATASFAVVAHRRQRQLGMLASVGASDGQLRAVMLSNGIAVGAVSAIAGSVVALAVWIALNARLERAMNHRLSIADVPWWVAAATSVLSLLTATAAAWWPARAVTKVPVTEALSGRPPQAKGAVHRSLIAALVLLAAGCAALAAGVNTVHGDANPWLLIPGALAVVVGVLVLSPIAIRSLSRVTRRAPLPVRLALRDLNRYSARSGAALAAIALGLGIAVVTIVVATVAKQHFDEGNLPNNQVLFTTRNDFIPSDRAASLRADIDDFARTLGSDAHVYELNVLQNQVPDGIGKPGEPPPPLELARQLNAHSYRFVARIYVATPELLARLGLHPAADVDIVTPKTGARLVALTLARELPVLRIQHYAGPDYRSGPTTLITEAGMHKLGLPMLPNGWMVATDHPLTPADVRAARAVAAGVGMQVEARDAQASLLATRAIATAAGVLVALALLAMTIGLIRSEAGRDMQTLVATGASSFTRRALTAATSGSLALLGSVLGIGGAYLGLGAIYLDRISDLDHPPLPELAVLLLGLPLIAAGAGWLLSGREPVVIVRHALD
jgi:putative ABC transport system permease protein